MKYFTPERLMRLQERTDEKKFSADLEDWEQTVDDYREHLAQIRGKLPAELVALLESVHLHDAHVLDMWWDGGDQFTVTMHPESNPSRLVVVNYSLVDKPIIVGESLPVSLRSQPVAWLYDELHIAGVDSDAGPRFAHHILLSDGREVLLHFRDASVKRAFPFVPVMPNTSGSGDPIRHSA